MNTHILDGQVLRQSPSFPGYWITADKRVYSSKNRKKPKPGQEGAITFHELKPMQSTQRKSQRVVTVYNRNSRYNRVRKGDGPPYDCIKPKRIPVSRLHRECWPEMYQTDLQSNLQLTPPGDTSND